MDVITASLPDITDLSSDGIRIPDILNISVSEAFKPLTGIMSKENPNMNDIFNGTETSLEEAASINSCVSLAADLIGEPYRRSPR